MDSYELGGKIVEVTSSGKRTRRLLLVILFLGLVTLTGLWIWSRKPTTSSEPGVQQRGHQNQGAGVNDGVMNQTGK